VKENLTGIIGRPLDRYEGPLKVTGRAPYAYEVEPPSPAVFGVLVSATVASGRIGSIDTTEAEACAGVLLVWTHRNVPAHAVRPEGVNLFNVSTRPALESDRVYYFGQPVAVVVADTLENAQAAASLVRIVFEPEASAVDFEAHLAAAAHPPGDGDVHVGDFATDYAASAFKIDETWSTPVQNHCQMEPCASTAWWDGEYCTVHTSVQVIRFAHYSLAETLMIRPENLRLYARYVGGSFGGKWTFFDDALLAALAARELRRPVKIAFTRRQMILGTPHRPATRVRVRLGATSDGTFRALSVITTTHCDRRGSYIERASHFARSLYAAPSRLTGHRLARLDLPPAGPMRGPGEVPGTLALEVAIDELAEKLQLDPVELRLRNEPEADPENGKPFSTRNLLRCMREGADAFAWRDRNACPGRRREGRWLVGSGMAVAVRSNFLMAAKAVVEIDAGGTVTVRQGMTDIGTGTYTILAQIAAETLGVPVANVRVDIGDSALPPAPGSAGQYGAATAGSAVLNAGVKLRVMIAGIATADPASPLFGAPLETVAFEDGAISVGDRSERVADLIARNSPDGLKAEGEIRPAVDSRDWSQQSYGAQFAEVGVDSVTGEVRVRRMLGVFAAGRILNRKTARSQLVGGMIWGVGSVLFEANAVDPRSGALISQDLCSYPVPTQADIGEIEAIMLDEVDEIANPLGVKGIGELGVSGAGAAIANAVYNACGVRVRSYPITPDKIVAGWP
jgi:xanthine dehydrogenase YagR molybdenum-binding subunit